MTNPNKNPVCPVGNTCCLLGSPGFPDQQQITALSWSRGGFGGSAGLPCRCLLSFPDRTHSREISQARTFEPHFTIQIKETKIEFYFVFTSSCVWFLALRAELRVSDFDRRCFWCHEMARLDLPSRVQMTTAVIPPTRSVLHNPRRIRDQHPNHPVGSCSEPNGSEEQFCEIYMTSNEPSICSIFEVDF